MFDSLINYLDKFGPEILVILFGFLVILSTLFLWLWFANRRKYHNLKHAIPANVVKSYLDSIIQNSTALKSQLFRGGGLDNSVPSVMPLYNLTGGDGLAMSGAPSTALLEELNQKKAQIASLEALLSSSQSAQKELENNLFQAQKNSEQYQARIRELEAIIAQMKAAGGSAGGTSADDPQLKAELITVTKERDELRDRLKEFEIIADDLANLKRLQQENQQLKRSLAAQGGDSNFAEPAAAPQKKADVSDLLGDISQNKSDSPSGNKELEDFLSAPIDSGNAESSSSSESDIISDLSEVKSDEDKPKSEKTPEDLLSEFEKMLG